MTSNEQSKAENLIMDSVITLRERLIELTSNLSQNSLQRVMKSWANFPEPPEINQFIKEEVEAINIAFKLIDAQVSASILAIGGLPQNKGESNE